jgi:cobalamin biosynthesis protein CobT
MRFLKSIFITNKNSRKELYAMKKKTGLILAAVGAGAGFLAGRFVERIATVKSLVDRIEDIGGSDDLEDYLYDRYGENNDEDEDEFYDEDEDADVEDDNADDDNDEDENDGDKISSVKVMEMSDEDFKKFIREL